jgi:hypothetical protein
MARERVRYHSAVRSILALLTAVCAVALPSAQAPLDREVQRWVTQTLAKATWDQKIGQLIAPGFNSTYLPTDSDEFDRLVREIQESHAGAVIAFGGTEPAPRVLLNPVYGTVILGQPLSLAATLNRLQAVSAIPLLASADFEFGAGMRIGGRHALSARHGDGRGRGRAAGPRGRAPHRRRGARWVCTSTSRPWPT